MKRGFRHAPDGFVVRFKNGLGLSVRWSAFHYCSAREGNPTTRGIPLNKATESADAEVAALWEELGDEIIGEPLAYVRPEHLVRVMDITSRWGVGDEFDLTALVRELEDAR